MKAHKFITKSMAFVLAAVLSFGIVSPVQAMDDYKKGATNNTTVNSAVDISSGNEVTNQPADTTTKYYYVYTASDSGYVNFTTKRAKTSSTNTPRWTTYVYDAEMNQICYKSSETEYTTQALTVNKGTKYFLEVYGNKDEAYSVQAAFTAYSHVEQEKNDTASDATKLSSGEKFIGSLSSSSDVDIYKFTASKNGVITMDLDRYDYSTTDSPEWYFTLYDEDMNEQYKLSSSYSNDSKNTVGLHYAIAKGKTVYMKVSNDSSATGFLYSIQVSFTAAKNVETEPNNSYGQADKISLSKTYYACMAEQSGDYYKLKVNADGKYKVTMSLNGDVNYGYKIRVYNSKRKLVKTSDEIFKKGSVSFSGKKGKSYFIVIEHASSGLFGGYSVGKVYKLKTVKK